MSLTLNPTYTVSLQGPYKTGLSDVEARAFLGQYQEGTLGHDDFPKHSFVFKDEHDMTVFYDGARDTLSAWSWADAPEDGWYYLPATEMALTKGGLDWWRDLRAGVHTPSAHPTVVPGLILHWLHGSCPVQAEGRLHHMYFYFRARGQRWQFFVHAPGTDCFAGWRHEEPYGEEPYAAGYMPLEDALACIERAAGYWCAQHASTLALT